MRLSGSVTGLVFHPFWLFAVLGAYVCVMRLSGSVASLAFHPFWLFAVLGAYVCVMCLSGSVASLLFHPFWWFADASRYCLSVNGFLFIFYKKILILKKSYYLCI